MADFDGDAVARVSSVPKSILVVNLHWCEEREQCQAKHVGEHREAHSDNSVLQREHLCRHCEGDRAHAERIKHHKARNVSTKRCTPSSE